MAKKLKYKSAKIKISEFYQISLPVEKETNIFYDEYNIISKTIDSVNSFNAIYIAGRSGAKGPSTHYQQDLYRAMLIFACAGLDVFVKQLVKNKLSQLIEVDKIAEEKFKEYVKRGLKKDDKAILNTVALALIDQTPRNIFLDDYIASKTSDSLQSLEELKGISEASGLSTDNIFNKEKCALLKDAFKARNQIIHEMDINIEASGLGTTAYRTRRQRVATKMEKYIRSILNLSEQILSAYKKKFFEYRIGVDKKVK